MERFPADLVVEPNFVGRRIDVRFVERTCSDVHVAGTRAATIADEAATGLAAEPFYTRRRRVSDRLAGQPLMVRAVWTRPYPLLDATAQLSWLELVVQSDGQSHRRLRELELLRSHNPVLGLAWTLVHILPDDSDIVAAIKAGEPLLLTANVTGTDMLLSSTSQSLQRYWRGDVRLDHEFADMIFEEEGALRLDFSRLDLIQPTAGAL